MKSDALKNKIKIDEIQEQINVCTFNIDMLERILGQILGLSEWLKLETATIEDSITKFNKEVSNQIEKKVAWEFELLKYTVKPIEC